MKRAWALLAFLALASCHSESPPTIPSPPALLIEPPASCPSADVAPRPLSNLRTPSQLAIYANQLELSREKLKSDLHRCTAILKRVNLALRHSRPAPALAPAKAARP